MIRLSMNVLTSALALLRRIEIYDFSSLSELSYSKIVSISAEDIFEFSSSCGWASESESGLTLTTRGIGLLRFQTQGLLIDLKRQMLTDYVLKCAPIWANRIPYGRREATIFMTKDERACVADAGLLSDHLDAGISGWGDTIATHIRMQTKQSKIGTGRLGERNTIKYERSRTNIDPMWMSIDSNLLGYDIKSQVSKNDPGTLLIEVKASTFTLSRAEFYVTSNEWNVAITSGAYVFHLWCLSDGKKMLAILSPDEILPYIPTNNLDGQWETVKIPFLCFEDKFVEIA